MCVSTPIETKQFDSWQFPGLLDERPSLNRALVAHSVHRKFRINILREGSRARVLSNLVHRTKFKLNSGSEEHIKFRDSLNIASLSISLNNLLVDQTVLYTCTKFSNKN